MSPKWQKAAYGIALPNFLIAGALYAHTAGKLVFVRIFRHSRHLHSHTWLGWGVWIVLILLMNIAAFVLAVGVPIFNYLIGLAASLFAAGYTYGIAGAFFLHDVWVDHGGSRGLSRKPVQTGLAILWTLLAMGLMLHAHRRALRASWLVGAALLVAVVVKLLLVDLSNAQGWERIVTFVGVGVLMLVIGYFVPMPPKTRAAEQPA